MTVAELVGSIPIAELLHLERQGRISHTTAERIVEQIGLLQAARSKLGLPPIKWVM